MWIYIPYYRQICKDDFQIRVLNTIEKFAERKLFKNRSGSTIVKHKATIRQFQIIS